MAITGISFPFRKGDTSFPAASTDDDVIADNIRRILLTRRGERVMRPDEGSSMYRFAFENVGTLLRAQVNREVRRSIANGEPRARIIRVQSGTRVNRTNRGREIVVLVTYEVNGQVKKTQVAVNP